MLAFQAFLAFLLTVLLTLRRHHQGYQTAALAGLYTNTHSLAGKIARMPAHTCAHTHAHALAHTHTAKLSQNRTAAHGAVCLTDSYGGYLGEVHNSTSEILQRGAWQQKTPSFFY